MGQRQFGSRSAVLVGTVCQFDPLSASNLLVNFFTSLIIFCLF